MPPTGGGFRQTARLCATEMADEGVRLIRAGCARAAISPAPAIQVEKLARNAAVQRPEAIESRASEERLYLAQTSALQKRSANVGKEGLTCPVLVEDTGTVTYMALNTTAAEFTPDRTCPVWMYLNRG